MKKILIVAVLLMVVSAASFAQPTITNSNTLATATVVGAWTLTWASNLTFGNVYAGSSYTVASNVAAAGGLAFLGGIANTTVAVTWPLVLTGPGTDIPFTLGTVSTHNVAGAVGSTLYTAAVPTDATGHLWIYVGGTLGPLAAVQTAGNYSGAITVQIAQP
jgi:hypothetical protein